VYEYAPKSTTRAQWHDYVSRRMWQACEQAYFKMDNLLIDDRRIRVDFSQSVSKLKWEWERNMQRKKEGKPVRPTRAEWITHSTTMSDDGIDGWWMLLCACVR